jgi:hypothetical protein
MKLSEVADQYVTHKQSMGMRFCTEQRTLKSFCRAMGDIAIADVGAVPVLAFGPGDAFLAHEASCAGRFLPLRDFARLLRSLSTPYICTETTSGLCSLHLHA